MKRANELSKHFKKLIKQTSKNYKIETIQIMADGFRRKICRQICMKNRRIYLEVNIHAAYKNIKVLINNQTIAY